MRAVAPPSVNPWRPAVPKMAPIIPLTMPLRMSPAEGGEPAQHDANPARSPVLFCRHMPRAPSATHLALVHPLGVRVALPFSHSRTPLTVESSPCSPLAYLLERVMNLS